jgi:hypothetical protein
MFSHRNDLADKQLWAGHPREETCQPTSPKQAFTPEGITMLSANGIGSNGSGIHAQLYGPCASDYEAVAIDVTPAAAPKPGWKDAFPQYTHNLSWVDSEGCSHSMTLRSDSLSDLMSDLKMLKNMIRQAKGKARESATQQDQQTSPDPQVQAANVPDVQRCEIHAVDMVRRWSKRTQGHYFGHKLPTGDFCYGRERKA